MFSVIFEGSGECLEGGLGVPGGISWLLEAILGRLGMILKHLEGLPRFLKLLEWSRDVLGRVLSGLGVVLRRSLGVLGLFWGGLGVLGASWGDLQASWDDLGIVIVTICGTSKIVDFQRFSMIFEGSGSVASVHG